MAESNKELSLNELKGSSGGTEQEIKDKVKSQKKKKKNTQILTQGSYKEMKEQSGMGLPSVPGDGANQ